MKKEHIIILIVICLITIVFVLLYSNKKNSSKIEYTNDNDEVYENIDEFDFENMTDVEKNLYYQQLEEGKYVDKEEDYIDVGNPEIDY